MAEVRKKFTPHSEETITRILELHDEGMRSKDISKQSKEIFGFKVQQSSISNILARNGRNAKANTFRMGKNWKNEKKNGKFLTKEDLIPYSNNIPPHDINYEV